MAVNDEDSKLYTSALVGVAGFLASHVFTWLAKKGDAQDGLNIEQRVLETKVERLEQDLKDLKEVLMKLIERVARRHSHDDE